MPLLYHPIYAAFWLPATLTLNRTNVVDKAVTAIEQTSAADGEAVLNS